MAQVTVSAAAAIDMAAAAMAVAKGAVAQAEVAMAAVAAQEEAYPVVKAVTMAVAAAAVAVMRARPAAPKATARTEGPRRGGCSTIGAGVNPLRL